MPIIDLIKESVGKVLPKKEPSLPTTASGIGHVQFGGEDLILTKPFIVASSLQIFFVFIAMCCFAGVASFQGKFGVGPSALSSIAIFLSVILLFLSAFLLAVPVVYDKYDKLHSLARALRELRVAFICNGIGGILSLIAAFSTTISAFTQPGCKDATKEPHADMEDEGFVNGLPDWCRTKKAGAFFFWFTLIAWIGTTALVFQEYRTGKTVYRPKETPFRPPEPVNHEDDEDPFTPGQPYTPNAGRAPRRRATDYDTGYDTQEPYGGVDTGRPSMDTYGAFRDDAPSGYGPTAYSQPDVSRTMQYADPYAVIKATVHSGGAQTSAPPYDYRS